MREGTPAQGRSSVFACQAHLEEVHRRAADETGDEDVGRLFVELVRRADLHQPARVHDRHARADGERFRLVVCHRHDRASQVVVQVLELDSCVESLAGVEVGEGVIEQQHRRSSAG